MLNQCWKSWGFADKFWEKIDETPYEDVCDQAHINIYEDTGDDDFITDDSDVDGEFIGPREYEAYSEYEMMDRLGMSIRDFM